MGNGVNFKKSMKSIKNLFGLFFCMAVISACGNDDGDTNGVLEKNFISVENGEYNEGSLPVGTNDNLIESASFDSKALPGGSSYLELNSTEELDYLNVSVKDVSGYFKVKLENPEIVPPTSRVGSSYRYTIIITISQNLEKDFTLEYTIVSKNGDVSPKYSSDVEYVKAGTGVLQVNLKFNNEKDVDLHVEEPDGNVINYWNCFPSQSEEYEKLLSWEDDDNITEEQWESLFGRVGLDIDSNAGCEIDGINSENVFFEKDCMQKGKYNVYVNLFDNCDPRIATDYVVRVIYKGKEIAKNEGRFEIGAEGNGDDENLANLVKVLDFTIDEGLQAVKSRTEFSGRAHLLKGEFKMLINKNN